MKIVVKHNQTIWDIAVQYTGNSGNVVAILLANQKTDMSLSVGECLKIPFNLVSQKYKDFFQINNVHVGTNASPMDTMPWVPPVGGATNPVREGIAYLEPNASSIIDISYADYDAGWRSQNGEYINTQPEYPLYFQTLDYEAASPYHTLKFPNIFGNFIRFTNDEGGESLTYGELFIDHLTGRVYLSPPVGVEIAANWSGALAIGEGGFFLPSVEEWQSLFKPALYVMLSETTPSFGITSQLAWTCNVWESDPLQAVFFGGPAPPDRHVQYGSIFDNKYVRLVVKLITT